MPPIKLISPVDGSTYAERIPLTRDAAFAAVTRAKLAQKAWAARPLAERIALVKAGVAGLKTGLAMLQAAFGDAVIDHHHHAAQREISESDRVVTDFEQERLLERA